MNKLGGAAVEKGGDVNVYIEYPVKSGFYCLCVKLLDLIRKILNKTIYKGG